MEGNCGDAAGWDDVGGQDIPYVFDSLLRDMMVMLLVGMVLENKDFR